MKINSIVTAAVEASLKIVRANVQAGNPISIILNAKLQPKVTRISRPAPLAAVAAAAAVLAIMTIDS